ncbi:MAG: hypothetical protein ABIH89_01015 [Elusimicrobiota bacterium]
MFKYTSIFAAILTIFLLSPVQGAMLIEDISSDAGIIATGGAYEGTVVNANAVSYNPSAIANMLSKEVAVSFGSIPDGDSHQNLAFGYPLENGVFGAAVSYFGREDYNNLIGAFSYGHRIYSQDKLMRKTQVACAGIAVKLIHKEIADEKINVFAADFGLLYMVPGMTGLNIGAVFKNLGGEYEVATVRMRLPSLFELNISKKDIYDNLDVSLNGGQLIDGYMYYGLGAQYKIDTGNDLFDNVIVRAGLTGAEETDPRLTAGLGTAVSKVSLDYGVVLGTDELDPFHVISARYRFGKEKEDPTDVERLYQQGIEYYVEGNLSASKKYFEKVIIMDKTYKQTFKYLEQINKVIIQLKRERPSIERDDTKTDRLMQVANRLFNEKKYRESVKYYVAVLVIDKENFIAKQKIEEAERILEETEESEKRSVQLKEEQTKETEVTNYYDSGMRYMENKKYESALWAFDNGSKAAAGSVNDAWKGKFSKQISKTRKKLAEGFYEQGYIYYQQNKFEEAVVEFKNALKYDAYYEEAKGKIREVEDKILQINRKKAERLYEKGLNEYTVGNIEEAISLWEQTIQFDKDHAEALKALERAKARR